MNRSVNLAAWAERGGVARVTACRWFHAVLLLSPSRMVQRLILVDDRLCHPNNIHELQRMRGGRRPLRKQIFIGRCCGSRVDTDQQNPVDKVVTEVGSALNAHGRKFLALMRDSSVTRILVENRDRFCRFGSEYVQAALAAESRELMVVDTAEVDNNLVRDMTEILTLMWHAIDAAGDRQCPHP